MKELVLILYRKRRLFLRGSVLQILAYGLRKLKTLSLMDNQFEGAMPKFRKLGGTLKSLCISKNNYSGNIDDDAFLGMSSLKRLDIEDNKFSGEVPTSLVSKENYSVLEMNHL